MSLYKKYLNGEIEPKELSQYDFNILMVEWYADYKERNGTCSLEEFIKLMEYNF